MEKSSFFTSLNGDRKYKASEFAEYFSTLIGNGVFPNPSTNLDVVSNGDMTITIRPGFAFINGYMYHNTDNLVLTISHSDSVLKRVDRVVLRCDFIKREIKANIKEGLFSDVPVAKKLQRDVDAYEICIAEIKVNSGVIQIQQSEITSTKLDSNLCGIVTQTVKEIDTTTLFNKLEAYIEERGKDVDGWLTTFKSDKELSFNDWFDAIKGVLSGDVAGNLANKILEVENKLKNMKLESTAIDVVDTANNFTADSHGKKLLEDVLVQIDKKAKEAFQGADSGKKIIATAVGSPLSDADTFSEMGNKIDELLAIFRSNLRTKGIAAEKEDKLQSMITMANKLVYSKLPKWFSLSDAWISATTLQVRRHNHACAVRGDKIYVMNGYKDDLYPIQENEFYSPVLNTTTRFEEGGGGRSIASAVATEKGIYIMGGTRAGNYLNSINFYDFSTKLWSFSEAISFRPRNYSNPCCYYNGKVYYAVDTELFCMDAQTKVWSNMPTISARGTAESGYLEEVDGKLYLIGGKDPSGGDKGTIYCFDPSTSVWTIKASSTVWGYDGASGVTSDKKIIMGGSTNSGTSIYDPVSDVVTSGKRNSVPKYSVAGAVHGNHLYVLGGYQDRTMLYSIECYVPKD